MYKYLIASVLVGKNDHLYVCRKIRPSDISEQVKALGKFAANQYYEGRDLKPFRVEESYLLTEDERLHTILGEDSFIDATLVSDFAWKKVVAIR